MCVTGLVVVDTGTYFSTFGQDVILALIQAGGLGHHDLHHVDHPSARASMCRSTTASPWASPCCATPSFSLPRFLFRVVAWTVAPLRGSAQLALWAMDPVGFSALFGGLPFRVRLLQRRVLALFRQPDPVGRAWRHQHGLHGAHHCRRPGLLRAQRVRVTLLWMALFPQKQEAGTPLRLSWHSAHRAGDLVLPGRGRGTVVIFFAEGAAGNCDPRFLASLLDLRCSSR